MPDLNELTIVLPSPMQTASRARLTGMDIMPMVEALLLIGAPGDYITQCAITLHELMYVPLVPHGS